jgi:hypothetical protein
MKHILLNPEEEGGPAVMAKLARYEQYRRTRKP